MTMRSLRSAFHRVQLLTDIAMAESIRLGQVAGIRVGVNWSVLVMFWLVSWGLAAVIFPRQVPGQQPAAYWAAGAGAAALFFGSLLAHELAHGLLARREGVRVDGITLWLFGGVAKLSSQAENPGAELRIATVGPLASLVVAVAAGLLAVGATAIGPSQLPAAALAWLAGINAILAVFNLIPAAPMDGGRILRAVLWGRTGNRLRASVTAVWSGRLLAALLIGFGLVELAAKVNLGGLWFVLLGWFLLIAARAEERTARLRETLGGIRIRGIMMPDPVVAPSWLTVDAFLEAFVFRHRVLAFPVQGLKGALAGVVTLGRLLAVPADQRATTRVAAVACPLAEVPTASPDELLLDVLPRLAPGSSALVMDDGRLVGILSPTAIARTLELAALRPEGTSLGAG
jgi:Zn-dependent protease